MKWILMAMLPIGWLTTSTIVDFSDDQQNWYVLNDGVMGGLSKGTLTFEDGLMIFEGKVSLENNGGFASIRNPWNELDLSDAKKIKIRYRSTGQNFAMTLEREKQWYQPNFKVDIPISEEWRELTIKPSDFKAHQVGRKLDYTMTKDEMKNVIRMGFITNDKAATNFKLEIDYIQID